MLGARLRTLRLVHGWTQHQLAARGCHRHLNAGTRACGPRHRAEPGPPAAALDISLPDLLDDSQPLAPLPAPLPPMRPGGDNVDLHRLVTAWARIRPALRPHLLELANTLAVISGILETPAAVTGPRPPVRRAESIRDRSRRAPCVAKGTNMGIDDTAGAWERIDAVQVAARGAMGMAEVALAGHANADYLRVCTHKADDPAPARQRALRPEAADVHLVDDEILAGERAGPGRRPPVRR